jgi:phytanoyl-CoA hydroxylase
MRLLSRLQTKLRTRFGPACYSQFGGLWTDRLDALDVLDRRAARLPKKDADDIEHFIREGYVILQGAVDVTAADELVRDIEDAWAHGSDKFRVDILGKVHPLRPEHRAQPFKLLDLYASSEAARRASFAEPIVRFLTLVFDEAPLAFQSLTFERGTQQDIHQDTAYVVVSEPMKLAASWVALEDIHEGTGELEYYAGSHRLPDTVFGGRFKHWNPGRDGEEPHRVFLQSLHDECAKRGMKRLKFRPKKGDALIWSADLAHGGSKIDDPTRTRKSHVTHYCPRSVEPHFMRFARDQRTVLPYAKRAHYSSMYYPLGR